MLLPPTAVITVISASTFNGLQRRIGPFDREHLVYHMDTAVCCHGSSGDPPEDLFQVRGDMEKRMARE
ncbi:hypothetical protein SKAU_G00301730 [Synaphobranchus kaupii]|uniref:Uncharacterized protein n=1 Tax=Synaphobranchus kaupii TaxID=118154 RepID=A0A9Q1EVV8_SYNKA|nr:hypothetical protein SKAU_G00301730 [Synaphobranchus kaupii]